MLRICSNQYEYVPLKQVNIQSIIRSFVADVTIKQIFRNDKHTSVDVIYYFPIEEQAAIYNFTAQINKREINVELKKRKDFQKIILFKHNEQSSEYFIINIGLLPPLTECLITISYVTELDLIQKSIIRFVIPTTIAIQYKKSTSYRIEFQCSIEKSNGIISQINSPSHNIDIDLSIQEVYLVTFTQNHAYLDRDIILDIKLSDKRANTCVLLESNAAMAAVTPFEDDSYIELNNQQINEFIFLIDCSKSMKNENKIGLVREAMLEFIENLPKKSYFNIIKFGTKYTCLFNQSTVSYNPMNIQIAQKFINQIRADLNGTDILEPLKWLEFHPIKPGRSRQVFLLTDGEISNVSDVLEFCHSLGSSTRIFSFGLGISPRRSLIKGLAKITNGRYVFIPPNTNINIHVKEQLEKSIRRNITDIRIQWNLGIDVENIPNQLPSAYMNDRLIIYALTTKQSIPFNHKSSIEIRTDQSYYHLDINDSDRLFNNNQMIARLAAKALIIQLEHSKLPRKDIKQRIIDLSLQYHILSPYTSFIGIEKHLNVNNIHEIPTNLNSYVNGACYYRNQDSIEQAHLHRNMFTPLRTRSSIDDMIIVCYLINKQTVDGLWNFKSNRKVIKNLTGKSLSIFQLSQTHNNSQILITAIIIILLEVKFLTLQILWDNTVKKARQCLIRLLNNDWKKLVSLFRDIRIILNE